MKRKIHFIGIGGIGVSGLARYYYSQGNRVSGTDLVNSEIVSDLRKLGIKIKIGSHKEKNLPQNPDLVIYSAAVKKDNPEIKKAKALGIEVLSYAQALGRISRDYYTLCVAGTHGKSTCAAMTALVLIKAGVKPTVILGTKLREFNNSNFWPGRVPETNHKNSRKKPFLVLEADEWQASFLNYHPEAVLITNIEKEHLDFYKNLRAIKKAFKKFISQIPKGGILVYNHDSSPLKDLALPSNIKVFSYSLKQRETERLRKIIQVPGKHNLSNALGALTLSRALGISDRVIFQALKEYQGAWRRFSLKKIKLSKGRIITLVDDYAHHPTEIKATLRAAQEKFGKKRPLWLVFQPHQINRTIKLFSDFKKAFGEADKVMITDIYEVAGREENYPPLTKKTWAEKLALAIEKKGAIYTGSLSETESYLKKNLCGGEVLLLMGAGDIYNLSKKLAKNSLNS